MDGKSESINFEFLFHALACNSADAMGIFSRIGRSPRHGQLCLFIGTLCLYGAYVLFVAPPDLKWDEPRYLDYARNLANGYYADPSNPELVNGPGYPFLLMLLLDLPLAIMRLVSALLMAFAVWFTYRMVLPYAGPTWAFGVALVISLHPMMIYVVPHLLSEGLALFCVAGFGWAITFLLRQKKATVLVACICVLSLGWLTLTRVLFGYVLTVTLVLAIVGLSAHRQQVGIWSRVITILLVSLAACSPYLIYSYKITGEPFKWSTNGGELLYWATSTNPGERGSWFDKSMVATIPELRKNHGEFYEHLETLPHLQREREFRSRAMENIEKNPLGVMRNWGANVNRLLFGFPRSYRPEEAKTTVLLAFQLPIIGAILLAIFCIVRRPRTVPPETYLLASMSGIYLGMSSLLPAETRYFLVILPWLGFIIAATLAPRLKVQLRLDASVTPNRPGVPRTSS